jgi:hypothetical protein
MDAHFAYKLPILHQRCDDTFLGERLTDSTRISRIVINDDGLRTVHASPALLSINDDEDALNAGVAQRLLLQETLHPNAT